jgi:hypothetical protein
MQPPARWIDRMLNRSKKALENPDFCDSNHGNLRGTIAPLGKHWKSAISAIKPAENNCGVRIPLIMVRVFQSFLGRAGLDFPELSCVQKAAVLNCG